jgi:hypothetical protein
MNVSPTLDQVREHDSVAPRVLLPRVIIPATGQASRQVGHRAAIVAVFISPLVLALFVLLPVCKGVASGALGSGRDGADSGSALWGKIVAIVPPRGNMAAGVAATAPAVFIWERSAYTWKRQRVRHIVVDPAKLQPR